ncbi:MAG: DUF4129 domain-containing protein [Dehalococcoidia bacterium]|nr:DUF4129 domain-containing protein [Dehalococcoidia bacterium]
MLWRERLATLAFLLMEGCWLAGVATAAGMLFNTPGAPLGSGGVLVGLTGAYYANRGLQQLPLGLSLLRLLSLLGAAAFLFLLLQAQYGPATVPVDPRWVGQLVERAGQSLGLVKGVILGAAFLLGLWWRGARLAASSDQSEAHLSSFKLGALALGLVTLAQAAFTDEVSVAGLVFPFFGLGLIGIALNQLAARERSQGQLPRNYWLAVTVGSVGLLLVAGLLLGLVAGPETTQALGKALGAIGGVVSRVLDILILGIAWIVGWLFEAVQIIFGWLRSLLGAEPQPPQELAPPPTPQRPDEVVQLIPDSVLNGLKWGLVGLLVLIVVLVLFFALLRRQRGEQEQGPAFRESLVERGQVRADLLAALASLKDRFRRQRAIPASPWGDSPRGRVLRSYADFLELAAEQGLERKPTVTPLEFLLQARSLFPLAASKRLTELFDLVRYGAWEPSPAEASGAQADMEALRQTAAARATDA